MNTAKVAIIKTKPNTVLDDYVRLCELGEMRNALDASKTTILKDNISWHLMYPSSNSTPWQLEGTILALKEQGFEDIVSVHNQTVVTIADLGDRYNKFAPVLEKYNIPKLNNFDNRHMKWVLYHPKKPLSVLPKIYPHGVRIPDYFIGKNILHLPTVKTHSYTVTTGAMKNAFGGLLNEKRHYTHTWIHDTLVDLLSIQKEIHPGIFAVMDGTTAGSGPGPRTLTPHRKDVILASSDQVAIDAVAAKIMGFDPLKIRYIARANDMGLGCGDPRNIEITGDANAANERWNFDVGVNFGTGVGMLLWRSPLKVFQKLLFHTPLVKAFIFASEIYHDKYWYPVRGKTVVNKWFRESEWGKLFQSYPE